MPAPEHTVDRDLLCIHCDYNLRTLPRRGVCPECGRSIPDTIRARTGSRRRRYVQAMRQTYALIAAGFGLCFLGGLLGLLDFEGAGWSLGITGMIIVCLSGTSLTVRPPYQPRAGDWPTRGALTLLYWLTVLPLAAGLAVAFMTLGRRAPGSSVAELLVAISVLVGAPLVWLAAMVRTFALARRYADPTVVRLAAVALAANALAACIGWSAALLNATVVLPGAPAVRRHILALAAFTALAALNALLAAGMSRAFGRELRMFA